MRCKREKRVLGFFVLLILENQGNEENVCVCVCVCVGGGGGNEDGLGKKGSRSNFLVR